MLHITHVSAGAVSRGKNFDEESNASLSTARDETRDGFYMEDGDPSVAQLLHERTFAFSFWPKVGGVCYCDCSVDWIKEQEANLCSLISQVT